VNLTLAFAASGIANVAITALLACSVAYAALVRRQRRDLAIKLYDQADAVMTHAAEHGRELHDALADNEDLTAENTVIRRENTELRGTVADLRDQIDRLNAMAIEVEQ
jgi:cell division protein FtsB